MKDFKQYLKIVQESYEEEDDGYGIDYPKSLSERVPKAEELSDVIYFLKLQEKEQEDYYLLKGVSVDLDQFANSFGYLSDEDQITYEKEMKEIKDLNRRIDDKVFRLERFSNRRAMEREDYEDYEDEEDKD